MDSTILQQPNSTTVLDDIEGLDRDVVFDRISSMTEAYAKFCEKQLEGLNAPNAEIPMYIAMAFSILNLVPFSIGIIDGDKDFLSQIEKEIMRMLNEDFSTCYNHGLDANRTLNGGGDE